MPGGKNAFGVLSLEVPCERVALRLHSRSSAGLQRQILQKALDVLPCPRLIEIAERRGKIDLWLVEERAKNCHSHVKRSRLSPIGDAKSSSNLGR
jgi:hypothetical protein